jgi:hypothetical protein
MDETARWQIFLETIGGGAAVKVTGLTPTHVMFALRDAAELQRFESLISNAPQLRARIMHAIPQIVESGAASAIVELSAEEIMLRDFLSLSASEMMFKLISSDFLKECGLSPMEMRDNSLVKIAELVIDTPHKLAREKVENNMKHLQSALSKVLTLDTLKRQGIRQDEIDGEISEFGANALKFTTDRASNRVTITFNYGLVQQAIQGLYKTSKLAPVISLTSTGSIVLPQFCCLDRNYLLKYLYQTMQTGLIFRQNRDLIQPIMFQPFIDGSAIKSSIFYLLLDISGSMEQQFDDYRVKVLTIAKDIIDRTENWEIILTAFNHDKTQAKFNHRDHNYANIVSAIQALTATGGTNLHGALCASMDEVQASFQQHPNSVLILCTDGKHESATDLTSEAQVLEKAGSLRRLNSQFSMFMMGFGQYYSEDFMNAMALKGGFTPLHLTNMNGMDRFNQYMRTINNPKVIYEFIAEAMTFFQQCAAGDIAIAEHSVAANSQVRHGSRDYGLGVVQEEEKKSSRSDSHSSASPPVSSAARLDISSLSVVLEDDHASAAARSNSNVASVIGQHTGMILAKRGTAQSSATQVSGANSVIGSATSAVVQKSLLSYVTDRCSIM